MTPAEMREAAAVLADSYCDGIAERRIADVTHAIAAAIRALPLPEEALTPREKLRRVREARELLATARVAFVPRGAGYVTDEATGERLGDWRPRQPDVRTLKGWVDAPKGCQAARTWVLDTLRAEGWDVVEEGEGNEEH